MELQCRFVSPWRLASVGIPKISCRASRIWKRSITTTACLPSNSTKMPKMRPATDCPTWNIIKVNDAERLHITYIEWRSHRNPWPYNTFSHRICNDGPAGCPSRIVAFWIVHGLRPLCLEPGNIRSALKLSIFISLEWFHMLSLLSSSSVILAQILLSMIRNAILQGYAQHIHGPSA